MDTRRWIKAAAAALVSLALMAGGLALAHEDRHRERNRHRGDRPAEHALPAADDPAYRNACGGCHPSHHPALLPAASWRLILEDHERHFGQELPLDDDDERAIAAFLTANAADRNRAKLCRKIMSSLSGAPPRRISEIPYLRHKHRRIAAEVMSRPAVGGAGNCGACHPGAACGLFDEHEVAIPR